jgi:tetratricopeptide (TPR) repeat protein
MLTQQDINIFFSGAYAKAALRENTDMRTIADLFETIRLQVSIADPYDWWDFIVYDYSKFDNDLSVEILVELKESYFNFFSEKLISNLNTVYKKNKQEALDLWVQVYAAAAVHYREDLLCMLYYQRLKWKKINKDTVKYGKLPKLIQESRWPDAYLLYAEIATNTSLTNEVRAFAEITLLQIVLYYYPEYSRALKHIENATALLPDHFIIKRGWAEYYLKTGDIQKARNNFLQVIASKPGDYGSFNYIGDCFYAEAMLENAESWYNDALQKNFLQTDSYARLINLYGDKKWFSDKKNQVGNLLLKIKTRYRFNNSRQLIENNLATENCFKDLALYQSYRDAGSACFANDDIKSAEEWYKKAWDTEPDFATAVIDIAYIKMHQQKTTEAKEYFLRALELDKDNFEVYRGLAYYFEKQELKEEAIKAYQECLRLRTDWGDWVNNFIGNLHYASKDYNAAATYFRKAVKANDNYLVYKQNLADALEAQAGQLQKDADYTAAEKLYIATVELCNEAGRWNTLGNFYYEQKRWRQAVDSYDKAIALTNNEPVYFENRGLAFGNMNETAKAGESFKEAVKYDTKTGRYFNRLGVYYYEQKDYARSVINYTEALRLNPDEPVYLENIGNAYEKTDMPEKAEPYYLKLLEKEPANDKIMNKLGVLYYKKKAYEKALQYYNNAILHNNKNDIYYENLAILLRTTQQFPEAIKAFENALKIDPEIDVNWNDAGVLYFNLGKYDKALEYYSNAITLKPKVPLYYENKALVYQAMEQVDEALINYKKALEINPENARVLNIAGLIHYKRQEFETAGGYYQKAVELESGNWIYQSNLGLNLRMMQRNDEAISVYEKAVGLKDDDYLNWNELGVLFSEKGLFDKAINCYKKSISLQPNDATLYVNLALACNSAGKTQDAVNVFAGSSITKEIKEQAETLLQQYLPLLFQKNNNLTQS